MTSAMPHRITATQDLMRQYGVDLVFVAPSSDLVYLLDYPARPTERLTLLVIPQRGRPHLIVPGLDAARVADKADLAQLIIWDETVQPTDHVQRLAAEFASPVIAVSDQMWSVFLVQMLDALPAARFKSATELLRTLRMVKDREEVENLTRAAALADAAWEEFVQSAPLAGLTERQATLKLADLRRKHGLEVDRAGTCASGPNTASAHHITGDRTIRAGEAVMFDFGGTYRGYHADVTRTVHVGEPSAEFRDVYDVVLQANHAALAAVRPGVPCQEIDRAARRVIEAAGFGRYFVHRVGHGIGLDGHEEPYLVEGNTLELRPGMVFSDEPGIYIPGRFGIRVEDAVVVTPGGGEWLNHCRRELTIVG